MTDDKILATLIVDKEMVATDLPCTGLTLIAQYADRYVVLALAADHTCTLGFEGEPPVTIGMNELLELIKAKRDEGLH
jgi:hypothetical protein